jgi:hypothetical protein
MELSNNGNRIRPCGSQIPIPGLRKLKRIPFPAIARTFGLTERASVWPLVTREKNAKRAAHPLAWPFGGGVISSTSHVEDTSKRSSKSIDVVAIVLQVGNVIMCANGGIKRDILLADESNGSLAWTAWGEEARKTHLLEPGGVVGIRNARFSNFGDGGLQGGFCEAEPPTAAADAVRKHFCEYGLTNTNIVPLFSKVVEEESGKTTAGLARASLGEMRPKPSTDRFSTLVDIRESLLFQNVDKQFQGWVLGCITSHCPRNPVRAICPSGTHQRKELNKENNYCEICDRVIDAPNFVYNIVFSLTDRTGTESMRCRENLCSALLPNLRAGEFAALDYEAQQAACRSFMNVLMLFKISASKWTPPAPKDESFTVRPMLMVNMVNCFVADPSVIPESFWKSPVLESPSKRVRKE